MAVDIEGRHRLELSLQFLQHSLYACTCSRLPIATIHGHTPFSLEIHQLLVLIRQCFEYRLEATFPSFARVRENGESRLVRRVGLLLLENTMLLKTYKTEQDPRERIHNQTSLLDVIDRAPKEKVVKIHIRLALKNRHSL